MQRLRCANCNDLFTPAPQVPKQTYCSKHNCQKERRKQWQKNRLQSDPDYRANQSRAQKAWTEKNPNYWRELRQTGPVYGNSDPAEEDFLKQDSQKPSIKMDSLNATQNLKKALFDGVFRLKVLAQPRSVNMDVWIVELSSIHEGYSPILDSSRDD
jgi:hypothetical protein